jgi:hypothetical protein
MTRLVTTLTAAAVAAAVLAAGCSKSKDARLAREAVLALLQQEALSLKTDGEKMDDPKLGVKTTWNIEGVDVKEQPNNAENPWAGTIRFKIESSMKEVDGTTDSRSFEKRFEYVYSSVLMRWIVQYTPPAPTTPRS